MSPPAPTPGVRIPLSTAHAQALEAAIDQWSKSNLIGTELASALQATIAVHDVDGFDWQRFAKYAFRLAVLCLAMALFGIVTNRASPEVLRRWLSTPSRLRAALTAAVAVAVHGYGAMCQWHHPEQVWANEAMHAVGSVLMALAAWQLAVVVEWRADEAKGWEMRQRRSGWEEADKQWWILLLLSVIYGVTGVLTGSNLIWSCGIVAFGTWFGLVPDSMPGIDFTKPNYPIRTGLLGLSIICTSLMMSLWEPTVALWSTTRSWGLLYLFISLWVLSIESEGLLYYRRPEVARYVSWRTWAIIWLLLFASTTGYCLWYGLRYHDGIMKGFGLASLGIILCTKLIEFGLVRWNKPLFFVALAGSLLIAGRYGEAVWNLQLASP